LLQSDLVWENKDLNIANFDAQIAQLGQKVDVIVLPEMFTTGFTMDAEKLAESGAGETLAWMKNKASETNACIVGSFIVKDQTHFFNRLHWVFPDGNVRFYDKRHLFRFGEEDSVYTPGQQRLTVDWKGWKICPLVCYDLRFPVWSRNMASDPFDLLIYIANWPSARTHVWDILLKARAMENVCYVAGANRVGADGRDLAYDGHSQVVDGKGFLLNEVSIGKMAVLVTLEKNSLTDFRKKFNTLLDGDNFQIIL